MAYSKNRRLADLISSTGEVGAYVDASIVPADLHSTLDLTGKTITVATASASDNDTTVASTAFVQQEIASLVDSAPGTLNTLNELAAALGDDANYSTTTTNAIAAKLPLAGGTLTGDLILGDGIKLELGAATGGDAQLFHSGSNAQFVNATGDTYIQTDNIVYISNADTSKNSGAFDTDGAVTLYYNNAAKIATATGGVNITGTLTATGASGAYNTLQLTSNSTSHGTIINLGDTSDADYGNITQFASSAGEGGRMRFIAGTTETMNLRGGKVGIGTTNPDVKLEIAETASDTGVQLKLNGNRSSNGNVGDIIFENNSDSVAMIRSERVGGNNDAADLSFWTQTTGGSNSERMCITSAGNVFIQQGKKLSLSSDEDTYFMEYSANEIGVYTGGTVRSKWSGGNFLPGADNSYDLGGSGSRWRNIYTTDLGLSNRDGANIADGTWGDYTIQEGENDLFLINNRNNKIYKFNLTEVGDKPDLDSSLPGG